MTPKSDGDRDDVAGGMDRPLTKPLLVHGGLVNQMTGWFLGLGVFGCSFAVMGTIAGVLGAPVELVMLEMLLASFFGSPALFAALWQLTHRRWLEVTLPGFLLTRRGKKTAFNDVQVVAISQRFRRDQSGADRVVRLEIDCGGIVETIECRYSIPRKQTDPLAVFLDRVIRGLARRTHEGLSRGEALSGKTWRVDHDGLHCTVGGKGVICPLESLSRASHHDGHLCVWKGEEERPFLRIRSRSRNAYPLGVLLHETIHANPARADELPGKPLGRMLLDHHGPDRRNALFVIGGSFLLCMTCWAMALYGGGEHGWDWTIYFCLAAVPHGVLLAGVFQFLRGSQTTIHFHEAGISQPSRDGMRELLYTEVDAMTWKAGKKMLFTPRAGSNRSVVNYRSAYGSETAELIGYRDHAARIIAQRWLGELDNGPVIWTPRLRFLPGWLEYRPGLLIASGEPRTVPYDKIHYRIEHGKFLLFIEGERAAVLRERLDSVNFFSGLMLLMMIWERSRPSTTGPDVKTLAPRLETIQSTEPEKPSAQSDPRITAQGPGSAAVTDTIPDAGGLVVEDE